MQIVILIHVGDFKNITCLLSEEGTGITRSDRRGVIFLFIRGRDRCNWRWSTWSNIIIIYRRKGWEFYYY